MNFAVVKDSTPASVTYDTCLIFQHDLDDPERGMIFVCSATHKTKVSKITSHLMCS